MTNGKSLGTAIDEIIAALSGLDASSRSTAIRAVCDHLNMTAPIGTSATASSPEPPVVPGEILNQEAGQAGNIRSFKEQKNPTSATEMVCVLAYFLKHIAAPAERKDAISAADIEKYFVQANFPLPKRSDQLLVNAKAAGYFDSAERGTYRLNAVGHNLVTHTLPRKGAGTRTSASGGRKPRRKAKGRKRGK